MCAYTYYATGALSLVLSNIQPRHVRWFCMTSLLQLLLSLLQHYPGQLLCVQLWLGWFLTASISPHGATLRPEACGRYQAVGISSVPDRCRRYSGCCAPTRAHAVPAGRGHCGRACYADVNRYSAGEPLRLVEPKFRCLSVFSPVILLPVVLWFIPMYYLSDHEVFLKSYGWCHHSIVTSYSQVSGCTFF